MTGIKCSGLTAYDYCSLRDRKQTPDQRVHQVLTEYWTDGDTPSDPLSTTNWACSCWQYTQRKENQFNKKQDSVPVICS